MASRTRSIARSVYHDHDDIACSGDCFNCDFFKTYIENKFNLDVDDEQYQTLSVNVKHFTFVDVWNRPTAEMLLFHLENYGHSTYYDSGVNEKYLPHGLQTYNKYIQNYAYPDDG